MMSRGERGFFCEKSVNAEIQRNNIQNTIEIPEKSFDGFGSVSGDAVFIFLTINL